MDRKTARGALLAALLSALPGVAPAQTDLCSGISEAVGDQLTTVRVASGLVRPVLVTASPADTGRLFVVEQDGRIRILKSGGPLITPFLDIAALVFSPEDMGGNEEGLLGLAFHPAYATNGWFFVYHTDTSGDNVVARYTVSSTDPDLADPLSRQTVISFAHPIAPNHNGGMIAFSPVDGHLYIGTGDGGGSCDSRGNAQSGASHLGKLLRLDVDSLPFTIPPDNPFVDDVAVNDEIWALGLRNPWRWSFDLDTGDLYIGDVGQNAWEEINVRPASSPGGENFGWVPFEGNHCPNPSCSFAGSCVASVPPVLEYPNEPPGGDCAVTGGYVYRGCRIPDLRGTYFYADFCTAFIRTFRWVGGVATDQQDRTAELTPNVSTIDNISGFGEDRRGELYITDLGGEVFKVVPVLSALQVSGASATLLSLSGADWTWEDLQATSSHPITTYRVWRQDGGGVGPFDCVFAGPAPAWPGGDLQVPGFGGLFTYLVTAVSGAGAETSPGAGSDGVVRLLSPPACPL